MIPALNPRTALHGAACAVLAALLTSAGAAEDLRPLLSKANGQLVPLTAKPGKVEDRVFAETVLFIYEDAAERVVYTWELPPPVAGGPAFGNIRCQVTASGDEGPPVTIPVAANAVLEWDGEAGQSQSSWAASGNGKHQMLRKFQIGRDIASVKITGQLVGKSLVLEVLCDKALVAKCTPGEFGTGEYRFVPAPRKPKADEKKEGDKPDAEKVKPPAKVPPQEKWLVPNSAGKWMHRVGVPFLEHEVRAFPDAKVFATSFSDWRIANDAKPGEYPKLVDGSRNKLVGRFVYTASQNVREVLPNIPHAPSPLRRELGMRSWFQIDLDYPFASAFTYLERLTKRSMRDYLLLLTVWQNKGPEAALPTHYPAKGSEEEVEYLENLGEVCGKLGVPFALQEEYTDMYPDYDLENYDTEKAEFKSRAAGKYLCLAEDGTVAKGYKLRNTDPARYAGIIRPDLWLEFAEEQAGDFHKDYETSATYLYRHSSNPLTRSINYDDDDDGAGMARHVYEATVRLFEQQREIHEGPVLGRGGSSHWRYSGLIDGVTAQPGAGWKPKGGQTMRLLVDFDLLRNHPLNVSFGMGDLNNWHMAPTPEGGGLPPWQGGVPMIVLDQYRMQEVIFGHGAYLGGDFGLDEGMHFLENFLVLPVAKAYAGVNPVEIEYRVNGEWVDASAALWAEDLTVVRVKYENGLEIIANSGEATLDADGIELPQFGWVARLGDGLLAYTALVNGAVVDHARTADTVFVNARRFEDWKERYSLEGYMAAARGTDTEWQALHLNEGVAPVEMGGIKTDGCVHLRKDGREWVLTVFPKDAKFEVLLKADLFRAPFEVEAVEGTEKGVKPESAEGGAWWKLPLNGALHYRFPASR